MKKIIAIAMSAVLALSLTACGSELKVKNYSINDEAKYYYDTTGQVTTCQLSVSTHPSLQCGALTVSSFENTVTDEWYNGSGNSSVIITVYKNISKNLEHETDSLLVLTFSGSSKSLENGINTSTLDNYLKRYFNWSDRRKLVKFVEDDVNNDINRAENNFSIDYTTGKIDAVFANQGGAWTLTLTSYYNNDLLVDTNYVDIKAAAKEEPVLAEDAISSFVGDKELPFDYEVATDINNLYDRMKSIGYNLVNPIYQHNKSVSVTVGGQGESQTTYNLSAAFVPKDREESGFPVRVHCQLSEEHNIISLSIEPLDEKLSTDDKAKIVAALTDISIETAKSLFTELGTEIAVSDSTTARVFDDGEVVVVTNLSV